MPIVRSDDAPAYDLTPIIARAISQPKIGATEVMSALVTFGGGSRIAEHTHDHEEVLHVLEGSLEMLLDGERTTLEPGDTAIIPAGTRHEPSVGDDGHARAITIMPAGTVRVDLEGGRSPMPWSD